MKVAQSCFHTKACNFKKMISRFQGDGIISKLVGNDSCINTVNINGSANYCFAIFYIPDKSGKNRVAFFCRSWGTNFEQFIFLKYFRLFFFCKFFIFLKNLIFRNNNNSKNKKNGKKKK